MKSNEIYMSCLQWIHQIQTFQIELQVHQLCSIDVSLIGLETGLTKDLLKLQKNSQKILIYYLNHLWRLNRLEKMILNTQQHIILLLNSIKSLKISTKNSLKMQRNITLSLQETI